MKTSTKNKGLHAANYPVVIEYSEEDGGFIARAPALKYCTAFGESYQEAAREIALAIDGWTATARAHGTAVPEAGPGLDELRQAAGMINLTELARQAGLPTQTLFAKLRRGTALNSKEALSIARALNKAGLRLLAKT